MAINAQWVASTQATTTAATVYTTAAATVSSYLRDLVITNGGTVGASNVFVGMGASNVATSVASMSIPPGGTLILTQCQVPNATPVTAIAGSGTVPIYIGYALNVAYM